MSSPRTCSSSRPGIVKVLDLGFGELVGMAGQAGNVFDTDEGIVVGTTDFMSPEQVRDKPIDARTDLFSLGCTMYRLLTGAYAFPGVTREDRLVKRIRGGVMSRSRTSGRTSPYRLAAIVDRLLALRPDDRFGSAAEAAEALEALIPSAGRSERGPARNRRRSRPGAGVTSAPDGARSAAGLVDDRIGTPSDRSRRAGKPRAWWTGTSRNRPPPRASPPIARTSKKRASNPVGRCTRNIATR